MHQFHFNTFGYQFLLLFHFTFTQKWINFSEAISLRYKLQDPLERNDYSNTF